MSKREKFAPIFWPVLIIFSGILAMALMITAGAKKTNDIDFSCTSELKSSVSIHNEEWNLKGVVIITGYRNNKISLLLRGKLEYNKQLLSVDRKLSFDYYYPGKSNHGFFITNFKGHEKNPNDNAPDNIDYIFFDAYQNFDKVNIIKRIDERMVIIGDTFSPVLICVINND